jgi:hypothetical protein
MVTKLIPPLAGFGVRILLQRKGLNRVDTEPTEAFIPLCFPRAFWG